MEQFEQLLTCAICLDRYRNPKLLPCQHSFCMEPCLDGLVDYVRRQIKCPECRAEHRIPYQGVQGYPTNVTLQRFLELHIEITGEQPDPTSGQIMRRCAVCTEKAYCVSCAHCAKDVCPLCKSAHMDILRREISRINNQVRRSLNRLQDVLSIVEKNTLALQQNCSSVSEEVDEIYRRLSKALKDRTEYLRTEIDRYLSTELKSLTSLKENLELEISNLESNCDLADKHMQADDVEWEDIELLDAKEIFLKTIEFLRYFETEMGDYSRRVRFTMAHDPNQLVMHVANYGDLNIHLPHSLTQSQSQQIVPGSTPGLMRSKSDHRLATQFRQQEERGYDRGDESGRLSPLAGRKFGERYPGRGGDRYGRNEREYDEYEESRPTRSRIRSRFLHGGDNTDSDNDNTTGRSVRFSDNPPTKERERVLDTEDVVRGPLSGITRLYDSPRVMKRLLEAEIKKDKPEPPPVEKPKFQPPKRPTQVTPAVAQRQVSEEDEITKIKRQMKNAPGERRDEPERPGERDRPGAERVAALKREDDTPSSPASSRSSPASEHSSPRPSVPAAQQPSSSDSDESPPASHTQSPTQAGRKTSTPTRPSAVSTASRRSSSSSQDTPGQLVTGDKSGRSGSTDSNASTDSVRNTGAAFTTEEVKQILATKADLKPTETPEPQRFRSRFLPGGSRTAGLSTPPIDKTTKEEESSSEETSSSEESESEDEGPKTSTTKPNLDDTDIGPLLARSALVRDTSRDASRKSSREEQPNTPTSRYGSNSSYRSTRFGADTKTDDGTTTYYGRGRNTTTANDDEPSTTSRYGGSSTGFTSRFLNKSKSTAAVSPEEEDPGSSRRFGSSSTTNASSASNPRSRYSAMKDRRARLARSKSSHALGDEDDDETDMNNPNNYLASRGYGQSTGTDLSRSRSTHAIKSREPSPERSAVSHSSAGSSNTGGEKDGAALSSWARYLKNKYGARGKEGGSTSSSTAARRLSLGLPLRNDSTEDEVPKNSPGSPTSPTQHPLHQGIGVGSTKSQYANKRRQVFSVGSRGSEPGYFTWPRGVATGPDNSIVVADSSNHRVQVFDHNGIFVKEFGTYGNGEGEFDCLAGVAVNRIGQFIIADRYNHRIQVMDPSGRFLRAFGSQGAADGKFNYPWGVTTDALGFIYVCDKENHRVQVFQSDGTFVGKFGSHGNKFGQLDHPHYIAVSNTNRVIVSDSNNHRVQIFDVNGRPISSFGGEGSEEGQFKFPRSQSYSGRPSPARPVQRSQSIDSSVASGSGSGRPRVYPSGRLRQQSDPDLHLGRGIHQGVRVLGLGRRGVQGSGRSSSDVQLQYSGLRSRKPPHPSFLRSWSAEEAQIQHNDSNEMKRIKIAATVPMPPRRTVYTPPSIYRRRSSIF